VGEIPQRRVSTAYRLIERKLVGWCLRCCLRVGEISSAGHASFGWTVGEFPVVNGRTSSRENPITEGFDCP